jgi:histidine ammonia-lyase
VYPFLTDAAAGAVEARPVVLAPACLPDAAVEAKVPDAQLLASSCARVEVGAAARRVLSMHLTVAAVAAELRQRHRAAALVAVPASRVRDRDGPPVRAVRRVAVHG